MLKFTSCHNPVMNWTARKLPFVYTRFLPVADDQNENS